MSRIFKISSCINIGDLCTHHDHFGHFPKSDFGKIEKIFLKHSFDLKVCFYYEAIVVYVRFQVVHHRFTGSKQGSRLHGSSRKFQKCINTVEFPTWISDTCLIPKLDNYQLLCDSRGDFHDDGGEILTSGVAQSKERDYII